MKLNIVGTPVFHRIFKVNKRIIALRGGSRSGKSYALMQVVVIWLYTGYIGGRQVNKGFFTIARRTFPALRKSVMKDFMNYLRELNIEQFIDYHKVTSTFVYKGREVIFVPTDDEHKLRGIQNDFVWLNEVNDIPYLIFHQMIMRTTHTVFLDANPTGEPWFKTEIEEKRMKQKGDVFLDVSTYKDNPFLPEAMVEEIKGLKEVDKDLYKVYTLGEWVPLKGLIYPNWEYIEAMPTDYVEESFGLDFGFINPACFVRVLRTEKALYIEQLMYGSNMLLDEISERISMHNPGRVFCDSAEPRSIKQLRQLGINASPVKKGADSVKQGINFIKQHKIFLTISCSDGAREWKRYKWAEDTHGNLLEEPIKEDDHFSDAVRYALNRILGTKMTII